MPVSRAVGGMDISCFFALNISVDDADFGSIIDGLHDGMDPVMGIVIVTCQS